jgi:hypothetical protein
MLCAPVASRHAEATLRDTWKRRLRDMVFLRRGSFVRPKALLMRDVVSALCGCADGERAWGFGGDVRHAQRLQEPVVCAVGRRRRERGVVACTSLLVSL